MKNYPSLLLLTLAACSSPGTGSMEPSAGLQADNVVKGPVTPKTYSEWVESLPVLSVDSTAFRTSAQGKLDLTIHENGMDLAFDIQLGVKLEYQDLRHFKETIWFHAELPNFPEFSGMQQLDFAINVLADGEQLYLTPEFQDDGLGAQIKASGIGIEDMTLTLDIKLFEELMQIYWHTLAEADVDLSSLLPEGMSVEEFFERGLNPAGWARAYMLMSDIMDFQVDSNEVRIVARMKEELMGDQLMVGPGQLEALDEFYYEMSFNRFSGLPTSFSMNLSVDDEVAMVFELDFAEFEMGANIFENDHFNSNHIDRKNLFPVDTFVQMALASLHAEIADDDGDMAF